MYNNRSRKRGFEVRFRVSEDEYKRIEFKVKSSGLTKQEYLLKSALEKEIVVQGSIKMFKSLKDTMNEILVELKRIQSADEVDKEFLEMIKYIQNMVERVINAE